MAMTVIPIIIGGLRILSKGLEKRGSGKWKEEEELRLSILQHWWDQLEYLEESLRLEELLSLKLQGKATS